MDAELRNKSFLITGASGGIGGAAARLFIAEGARVFAHCHQNRASIYSLCTELGDGCAPVQADLRDEARVEAMYDHILRSTECLDGIVVNAGIWPEEAVGLHEMSLIRWCATIESDLTSAFLTCRGFMKHLAARPHEAASIVLVSSTAGIFGEAGHADYAAAKSAMACGLTLSLKNEIVALAPRGRVNCICPGWTSTPMAAGGLADEALVRRVLSTMPLKKVATPEDVAAAIVFLSSDALAGHLTGTILPVAGGMEGRRLD